MAAASDEWSVNSNDATTVSFVRPTDDSSNTLEPVHSFHPPFTYPIFGFDEVIFGYKGLSINVEFASHNCKPHVTISYDAKFSAVGDTKALDINKTLKKVLPASAFVGDSAQYAKTLHGDTTAQSWTPPGDLIHTYSRKGRNFEVWAGSLGDARVKELLNNIQVLILFFIEGGQMLPLDELDWALRRWRIYYLYEKTSVKDASNVSPYVLCGYATTWRFYRFTPPTPKQTTTSITTISDLDSIDVLQLPCRLRISQFLLLPPYQSSGHGSELYQLIYREAMQDSSVIELTVEDPSEEFDKLRDSNDWKVLEPEFRKAEISINTEAFVSQNRINKVPYKTLLPVEKLEKIRRSKKIAPRQFARLTELYLYSGIPQSHRDAVGSTGSGTAKLMIQKHKTPNIEDRKYYWWRILVRSRIYRKNKEVLMSQLEPDDRRKHIQDASRGQQDEYEGLLIHMLAKMIKEATNGGAVVQPSIPPKRKVIVEDDDDDDDDEDSGGSSSKILKT